MFDVGFGLVLVLGTLFGGGGFMALLEKQKFLSVSLQMRLEIAAMIIMIVGSAYLVIVGVRLLYLGVDNTGVGQGYSGRHGWVIFVIRYFPYISTGLGTYLTFLLLRNIGYIQKELKER